MQRGEHRVVHDVVAVQHGDGIGEVGRVRHLGKHRAFDGRLAVAVMIEVEEVVSRPLEHGKVDVRVRHVEPRVDVGALPAQRLKVDRILRRLVRRRVVGALHRRQRPPAAVARRDSRTPPPPRRAAPPAARRAPSRPDRAVHARNVSKEALSRSGAPTRRAPSGQFKGNRRARSRRTAKPGACTAKPDGSPAGADPPTP